MSTEKENNVKILTGTKYDNTLEYDKQLTASTDKGYKSSKKYDDKGNIIGATWSPCGGWWNTGFNCSINRNKNSWETSMSDAFYNSKFTYSENQMTTFSNGKLTFSCTLNSDR